MLLVVRSEPEIAEIVEGQVHSLQKFRVAFLYRNQVFSPIPKICFEFGTTLTVGYGRWDVNIWLHSSGLLISVYLIRKKAVPQLLLPRRRSSNCGPSRLVQS